MSDNFEPVDGGFLQSDQWEKFQKGIGRETFRVDEGGLSCLAIKYNLPMVGGYFFIPRGPVASIKIDKITNSKNQTPNKIQNPNYKIDTEKILNKLIGIARENSIGWIRVEPQSFEDLEEIKKLLDRGYKITKSKKDHEPAQTLLINLQRSEEDILGEMKPKTRYNVRLSGKKGVEFFTSRKKEEVDAFLDLMKQTAQRDGIVVHPGNYYRQTLELIPEEHMKLILAKYEGKIIAGVTVCFYGKVATYLHGASSNELRNLMAPFGLQWEAMKMAKTGGRDFYDLGGISVETENYKTPKKNWAGITRFKTGFCPDCPVTDFPGCWDIILDKKKYWMYRTLQGVRDLARQ